MRRNHNAAGGHGNELAPVALVAVVAQAVELVDGLLTQAGGQAAVLGRCFVMAITV